jgi:hypothetical protein
LRRRRMRRRRRRRNVDLVGVYNGVLVGVYNTHAYMKESQ